MGSKYVLRADPSFVCYSTVEHQVMMVISVASILLYVVGVPILVFSVLRYGKTKFLLNEKSFQQKFGWAFMRFKEDHWWWQAVWHVKRIVFVLVGVFIEHGIVQALSGMLLIVLFSLLHFSNMPFHLSYLDYLEGFLLFGSFVLLVAGIFFSSERFDAELQYFTDDVLLASALLLIIFLIAITVAIFINFSHFFMSRYVTRLIQKREKSYTTRAKGRAKGLLLKRLSMGNVDTSGVMEDQDRQKAIAAAFGGGMERVKVLKNSMLDEQLAIFSGIFKPLKLVPWVKDSSSDFEAFRDLAIISEVVTTSDFAADRDLYEANRLFFRKITKAVPEIIDWLAFSSRSDLIAALSKESADNPTSQTSLLPVVSSHELEMRQSLADGIEALRRSWVNIRIRFVQMMRKKKMGEGVFEALTPEGFHGVRKLARGRPSIGNMTSAALASLNLELGGNEEEGEGEVHTEGAVKSEEDRKVGKYHGRAYKMLLPEKRQYILQLLVDSYNRSEAAALIKLFARIL
eukprot:CAMPEP_0113874414 /NCGR_PEP_ID=MMETSP0780_2-20120614/4321_1 /TAXON_ID=652834 /ORGANISM="Palpitomonas bilix" /LENGTH=514 /DNA_ID=CAMNT_0000860185 /DNA_START=1 /DNA_END=1543 /DNA_ORIENTATION=+ /assembly_acc=CAM_ASM_000599